MTIELPLVEYDSAARRASPLAELAELIRYRDLVQMMVANIIKTRYKRSALGVVWTLLNPLLNMAVLTLAFSALFSGSLVRYPIYVLTGPSGLLFRPMADTMAFALVGALLCALTLLPVLCAIFLRRHVKEPVVPLYERVLAAYGRLLDVSLRNPKATTAVCVAVFVASLGLVPFIGAEFMPHLDEGALWVRATMPYTISFDEASKLGPQVRSTLMAFPQVTTVANELGRPDDGTDPIGFFNDEYFVGLRSYDDPSWKGPIRTKPQLIEAIQEKLKAFPGIIFNYTQPAEDAVDEAETGLKSSLAVKIFGPDLATLG